MGKFSGFFGKLSDKWTKASKKSKIAIIVSLAAVIFAIIYLIVYVSTPKYGLLYSNLDATDAQTVFTKLKDDYKVTPRVKGNSIYVPENQVDSLRLQLASSITNGDKGFELFDSSSSQFGMTDQQFNVTYQRALEGEFAKTFKSFPQVTDAIVHIVPSEDSLFVKDSSKASASVTLKLKPGTSLSKSQVKAMVALLCGGVKNLPKENVQILDDKMQLLTDNLYDSNTADSGSLETKQQYKSQLEKYYEKKAEEPLEKLFGTGNVKVAVDLDLNYDEISVDQKGVSPDSVITSQQKENDTNSTPQGSTTSGSTVDNNTSNTITNGANNGNSTSSTNKSTTNYDYGSSETKTVKSPGFINKMTASVYVNNANMDQQTQTGITDAVKNSIGFTQTRGDQVNVYPYAFDKTLQNKAQADLKSMQQQAQKAQQLKLYKSIGLGVGALALLMIILILIKKSKKNKDDIEELNEEMNPEESIKAKGIVNAADVQNADASQNGKENKEKQPDAANTQEFKPIDFEPHNEKLQLENQIKKYAKDKPDQVADVIKSWLTEDEG